MKKRFVAVLMALLMMSMIVSQPASAVSEYTACMNDAITHKYDLIDNGWSYSQAHEHYLWHTGQCYLYFANAQ